MSARSTRRRVLCAAISAALALAGVALASGATAASTPSPTPAVTEADADNPVTVRITEISPAILRPGEDLIVRATLTNNGTETIAEPSATLRLSRFRVGTRADVDAWVSAVTCTSVCPPVATQALPGPLAPGQTVPVDLAVPAASVRLLDLPDAWGPRGISVEALDGKARVGQERSFLLWFTDSEVARTPVSVLAPVVGPGADPVATTDESAELDALTAPGGRLHELSSVLAANPRIGVAVDPALLADAAAGTTRTRSWAQSLTADLAGHDVLTLPWSDPDVGAAARAEQGDLITLGVGLSATSASSDTGVLWAAGAVDQSAAAVTALVDESVMVVAPGAVDVDATKGRTPDARVAVRTPSGSVTTLAPDAVLTRLLADPLAVDAQATPATTTQRALAELAVVTRESESDQPHLLLAPGRDWMPDEATVDSLLTAFGTAPWVDLTDAGGLLDPDAATSKGTLPPTAVDPLALDPASVQALADARAQAVAFATVTSDPDQLLAGVDAAVLAPLAVAWRQDPDGRADLVRRVLADVTSRTSGLTIGRLSDVNVISSTSEIPVTVHNDLDVAATVLLDIQPRKVCLGVGDIAPVTVAAKSQTLVRVKLQARANCDVVVVAQLTAASGAAVSPPVSFTAKVTPTIESVGTIVVGVLLAIGLVLGIARTVRRGQSGRRGARVVPTDPGPLPVLGGETSDE